MKDNLEPIFRYHMNEIETKAYQIGILWLDLSRKYFPNYKHTTSYPKKGDPRKSTLFKHCYKLVKEFDHLIHDYQLYIEAQLQILSNIHIGNAHPLIEPIVMVGEKAMIRWKMWKRKYDLKKDKQTLKDVQLDKTAFNKIKRDLEDTKKFFLKIFKQQPEEQQIQADDLERWLLLGRISPYYALLSPWFKKYCGTDKVDSEIYQESINKDVENLFENLFYYEF